MDNEAIAWKNGLVALVSKGNFNTGPHGLVFEPMDQNRTKVDQNMSRVQSKSFEFYKFY